jgi:hypothetical protein
MVPCFHRSPHSYSRPVQRPERLLLAIVKCHRRKNTFIDLAFSLIRILRLLRFHRNDTIRRCFQAAVS